MTDELAPITTEAEWDELLTQARKEHAGGEKVPVGLAAMLGDYTPMSDILGRECGPFFVKKPKLKQRLAMTRDVNALQPPEDEIGEIEAFVGHMLVHVCYKYDLSRPYSDRMRPATEDELVNLLDTIDEAQKLGTELLGIEWGEGKKGESSQPPITDTSSPA